VVSEGGIHAAVARARAGGPTRSTPVDAAGVRLALAEVPDPEIPVVSIVDLGIVESVGVERDRITVELLPTFVGCPALDAIREAVAARLAPFGRPVDVNFGYRVPWTSDRITPAGRDRLRAAGFAPPGETTCPWCGSANVSLDNLFGPSQCRSLHYCRSCRQPFEGFKEI
jgi:ring-1,2-phenylacetyl-CoA epoxidase subunit PaaD